MLRRVLFSLILISSVDATAQDIPLRVEMSGGAFQLTAKSSSNTGKIGGLGSYSGGVRFPFARHFEFALGYSLFASKVVGGDLGYGPDIGIVAYPWTRAYPLDTKSENVQMRIEDTLKPYLGLAFHQRDFQSVSSSYAGFGAAAGVEYAYFTLFSFKLDLRYIKMKGPGDGVADQIDTLFGILFPL